MANTHYYHDVIAHRRVESTEQPYLLPASERYKLRLRHLVPVRGFLEYCALTHDLPDVEKGLHDKGARNLMMLVTLNLPFLPFISSANA